MREMRMGFFFSLREFDPVGLFTRATVFFRRLILSSTTDSILRLRIAILYDRNCKVIHEDRLKFSTLRSLRKSKLIIESRSRARARTTLKWTRS